MGKQPKPAKPDVTSFTLKTKSTRGFTSNMTGKMRSPEQFGVVTAALCGQLADDANILRAAPDLRLAAQEALDTISDYLAYSHNGDPDREDARLMGEMDINAFASDGRLERLRAALSKASPSEGGEDRSFPSASGQEGGE